MEKVGNHIVAMTLKKSPIYFNDFYVCMVPPDFRGFSKTKETRFKYNNTLSALLLDFFTDNCGQVNAEQLHQDIASIEKQFRGNSYKVMLADYR